MADNMLKYYWLRVHTLYPYLNKAAFNRRYQTLWSGSRAHDGHRNTKSRTSHAGDDEEYSSSAFFFCLLNLVFALACQYSIQLGASSPVDFGDKFFRRAQNFINLDTISNGDCSLVQGLLLMGLYLQSADASEKGWNVVGLAIRVAHSIGLHLGPPSRSPHTKLDSGSAVRYELRKRVWSGCVMHDKFVSSNCATPCSLT